MSFSNILRNLRRKNDMTQEELSELLNLTPQAVSRWENGTAVPDTGTVCRLAYLFNVTTDYLLEVDAARMDDKVNEVMMACERMEPEAAAQLLRDTLADYPRHFTLMAGLTNCLYYRIYRGSMGGRNDRAAKKVLDEAIRLAEDLYRRDHGDVYTLLNLYRDAGQLEKGKELLKTLNDYSTVRTEMAIELAEGDEKIQLMKENAYILLSKLSWQVYLLSLESDAFPVAQRIAMLEQMFAASQAIMPDDEPFFYNGQPTHIPWQLAKHYSQAGEADQAIHWLMIMRDAAVKAESFTGGSLKSPALAGLKQKRRGHAWGADWMLDVMGDDYFDNIRSDPRFTEIQEELTRKLAERDA